MKKQTIIFIVLIGLGMLYLALHRTSSVVPEVPVVENTTQTNTTPVIPVQDTPSKTPTTPAATDEKSYTLAEVQTHKDATSCWTVVAGSVYDVTSFINKHPGGAMRILSLCGTDGTSAFQGQHDGQRRPEQELAGLKIGILK